MATWDDVRIAATRLRETIERVSGDGRRVWSVRDKTIAWERPPEAMPDVFFTTPHFDGHPAVLARLEELELPVLNQLLRDAWRHRAPKRLVREVEGG